MEKYGSNIITFIYNDDDYSDPNQFSPAHNRKKINSPWSTKEEYEDLEDVLPWNSYEVDKTKNCLHDWATYLGLNESFQYCKRCDEKKK